MGNFPPQNHIPGIPADKPQNNVKSLGEIAYFRFWFETARAASGLPLTFLGRVDLQVIDAQVQPVLRATEIEVIIW